jgi:murein DD-endopeptidase MepM/ murein hydrolase activator NlpD
VQSKVKLSFGGDSFYAYPILPSDNQDDVEWVGALGVDPLAKTGATPLRVYNNEGEQLAGAMLTVVDGGYKKQYITVSKKTAGLQPQAGEIEKIQALKDADTPTRYWPVPLSLVQPVPQCMNSPFGVKRYYNGKFSGSYHKGLDQKSPHGQVIKAAAAGKVQIANTYRLHGGTVGLDHGQGLTSVYIHMSTLFVKPGQIVKAGDPIGKVGSTGFAAGPHLHWGVYMNSHPVDPKLLTPGVNAC